MNVNMNADMEKKVIDLSEETGEIKIILPNAMIGSFNNTVEGYIDISCENPDPFDLVPKSWEECCEKLAYEFDDERAYCNLSGLCPMKDVDAFIAMFKLRRLWHEWVKVLGIPRIIESKDPLEEELNWIIHFCSWNNEILCSTTPSSNGLLVFREAEHAEKFIECFHELLDKAKILL